MDTNSSNIKYAFIHLVRIGIGSATFNGELSKYKGNVEWEALKTLAGEQGLSAIVLDGIGAFPDTLCPSKEFILNWIGEILQGEAIYKLQQEVSADVAKLYYRNGIIMYILKGTVVAECYPKPNHRVSVDVDCYLLPEKSDFDAWSLGNDLIRTRGFHVNTDFYKNSAFDISGVIIENHQFLTPFRGNDKLVALESVLQVLLKQDKKDDIIEGTNLYRPPVMVTALFLIEHAYSHFLHEGLTWRHVLDWMMFSKKHHKDINWTEFEVFVDEFGFRKFFDSFSRLGKYLLGEIQDSDLSRVDNKMLADVWAPLDLHDTVRGLKGKLALAGNTWRARWKYRYFTEMSWIKALWIQVKGFLFEKNPKLN